ncbi:putative quinol monooxygenase [Sphingomonas naphthae]|uniref:Quinol monooxygenase n=1 Tax=Sphingomonas naphthae TaxID=1813468 RepID=A0ABY7TNK9_9SPHN|nr:putative quinol monooxygenase [Sphingomonas naphthae]WCT74821.1 putative quinol monooxygenase [Sphingomonas naphthae]
MTPDRRGFLAGTLAAAAIGASSSGAAAAATHTAATPMHGLIGRMTAKPGTRDQLIAILLEGTGAMPGCLSYIVAKDPADADAIWITEVWDSKASHAASLSLPAVKAAIAKGRPLIAGFDKGQETVPVGGHGLVR